MSAIIGLVVPLGPEPEESKKTQPPEVCWRCGGKKEVEAYDGTMTPCGACLGLTPPKPCPECGSRKAKIMSEGGRETCWYCRDCGFRGPWNEDDYVSKRLWDELERKPC